MARIIRIEDIGDYANNQMEKLLRAAVLETDSLLKQASPVDTGRFRASWQVGENSAGVYDAGPQQAPINLDRTMGSPPAKPMFPIRRMNYQQEKIGNVYSVHNNLPYAEKLANGQVGKGGSKQTGGPGWVQGIAKDVQARVRKAADDIGRNS
jgi:hypothetical protein